MKYSTSPPATLKTLGRVPSLAALLTVALFYYLTHYRGWMLHRQEISFGRYAWFAHHDLYTPKWSKHIFDEYQVLEIFRKN